MEVLDDGKPPLFSPRFRNVLQHLLHFSWHGTTMTQKAKRGSPFFPMACRATDTHFRKCYSLSCIFAEFQPVDFHRRQKMGRHSPYGDRQLPSWCSFTRSGHRFHLRSVARWASTLLGCRPSNRPATNTTAATRRRLFNFCLADSQRALRTTHWHRVTQVCSLG